MLLHYEWRKNGKEMQCMFSICRLTSWLRTLSCKQHLAATSLGVLLITVVLMSRWTQMWSNTVKSHQNSLMSCHHVYVIYIATFMSLLLNYEILKVILCFYIFMLPYFAITASFACIQHVKLMDREGRTKWKIRTDWAVKMSRNHKCEVAYVQFFLEGGHGLGEWDKRIKALV